MKRFFINDVSLFIADILIFLICVGGLYLIILKADLPFKTSTINSKLIVSENLLNEKNINSGDEIISIDKLQFSKWEEVELYLDGKNIGDTIEIRLNSNGVIKSEIVQLKKFYDLFDLIIISLVGLIFFVMGVLVRVRASDNYSAYIFHWASVGLGMVIVLTAGYYNIQPFGYGHFNRIIWFFAYSVTPVLFIHFTATFSKKKVKGIKYVLWYFYVSAVINAVILSYLFLDATIGENFESLKYYVAFFDSFFRIFIIICI
ncbi:MAG TPA: hypothetical protein VLH59_08070, partial [Ignavibacteriaceae bacterium]|nr:hypothetical protein [Ignavibacteriaceae bacterium]